MAAKVTEVKVGTPGTVDKGAFRVGMYDMFNPVELAAYESLRTRAANRASGVVIDHIQQVTRKKTITTRTPDGDERVETMDELHMIVQYWDKPVTREKGDTDAEVAEAQKDWGAERSTD